MTDTNQLPEPELGYIQTDKSNQPAFSARQMREAMKHALQARAQVQGEPVAWLSTDSIGERHLCFTKPFDDPDAKPLVHQAPSVPGDVVRVPMQILKDASEALGNFVSDHGWGDADMQAMDNLDAYIARHEANRAAMLAAK